MLTASFSLKEVTELISSGQIMDAPTIAALGWFTISESR